MNWAGLAFAALTIILITLGYTTGETTRAAIQAGNWLAGDKR